MSVTLEDIFRELDGCVESPLLEGASDYVLYLE